MAVLIVLAIFVLIGLVVLLVGAPLRRAAAAGGTTAAVSDSAAAQTPRRDDLEAAREAKYREIRDAELDFRTGKLSEQDYRALDAELRGEALSILDALQALEGTGAESSES